MKKKYIESFQVQRYTVLLSVTKKKLVNWYTKWNSMLKTLRKKFSTYKRNENDMMIFECILNKNILKNIKYPSNENQ